MCLNSEKRKKLESIFENVLNELCISESEPGEYRQTHPPAPTSVVVVVANCLSSIVIV